MSKPSLASKSCLYACMQLRARIERCCTVLVMPCMLMSWCTVFGMANSSGEMQISVMADSQPNRRNLPLSGADDTDRKDGRHY